MNEISTTEYAVQDTNLTAKQLRLATTDHRVHSVVHIVSHAFKQDASVKCIHI